MTSRTAVFRGVQTEHTAQVVTRQLEELILTGVYRPGDRLPGERDLAKLLDVSRPTLRAAIKDLEDRDLLVSRRGGGTYVADIYGSIVGEPIVQLLGSHPRATADYMEFRRELEGMTARFAAERATDADREILTLIFERMEAAHNEEDCQNEATIDIEFHTAVCEAAHNVLFLHTLRSCYQLLARGIFYARSLIYDSGARDELLSQHRAIYEAVMDGDPERAERVAIAHIDFVQETMRNLELHGNRVSDAERRLQKRKEVRTGRSP